MDFFSEQDRARRNTGRLVILLILAVAGLVAVTTLVVAVALFFMGVSSQPSPQAAQALQTVELSAEGILSALSLELVAGVAAVVISLVVLGSLFKQMQLNRGGSAVAEALGGRQINSSTQDDEERRILNVVEEMALASGTPVPPVYVLEDDSINAFAAGYRPDNAVIGITRGAIHNLTRQELQGVVAHEFSHILHGDMRLNMRLISILHGILVIGLVGSTMLRSMRYRRFGGRGRQGNSALAVLSIGALLMLIGYIGTFFGNLIKSAVSRQREYLADASAVQFTRDPQSIGGALIKIGAHASGSRLEAAQADEFSHMFFGQGVKLSFNRMMATHPPVEDRIQRVMPDWDGRFRVRWPERGDVDSPERASGGSPAASSGQATALGALALTGKSAREAIEAMGQPGSEHLAYARQALADMPDTLREAAHDPSAARALIYGLLLSPNRTIRTEQLRALQEAAQADVFRELKRLGKTVLALDRRLRLPLVELALPALKSMSDKQLATFRGCLDLLIRADGEVSLFEWSLYQILLHNLDTRAPGPASKKLQDTQRECTLLLNVLAQAGQDDEASVREALKEAEKELPFSLARLTPEHFGISALNGAVSRLRRLKPLQKPALLKAMARSIEHNGRVSAAEAELFRAVADVLDCPMPPLLEERFEL